MKKTERKFTRINNLKDQIRVYEAHGEKTAFDYFDRAGNVRTMTYEKYARKIHAFCAGLKEIGKAGARIAIIGETSPKWHITYHAAICGGGIAFPLDTELAIEEIEKFLVRSKAEVIVFSNTFENTTQWKKDFENFQA